MSTLYPKFLPFVLIMLLGAVSQLNGQSKTALISGNCHSMSLREGTGYHPDVGNLYVLFTTYDGLAGPPLYDDNPDGTIQISQELRPRAGQPGIYEIDYGLLDDFDYLVEYGSMVLRLPTTDTDLNGLPDVVQKTMAGSVPVTGTGRSDWPYVRSFQVQGNFSRAAGAVVGRYALVAVTEDDSVRMNGQVAISHVSGHIAYLRGAPNNFSISALVSGTESPVQIDGSSTFIIPDVNHATLQAVSFTGEGASFFASPTALTRQGAKYRGHMMLRDGEPATSWPDYRKWFVEILDGNDSNCNGIPDLTDISLRDTTRPVVRITYPTNYVRTTNPVFTIRGVASDNCQIAEVRYRVNNGDFQSVSGRSSWAAHVTLHPGMNGIQVVSSRGQSHLFIILFVHI